MNNITELTTDDIFTPNFIIGLLASPAHGKSYMARYLLRMLIGRAENPPARVVCFTSNPEEWDDILPAEDVRGVCRSEELAELERAQRSAVEANGEAEHLLLILDDMLGLADFGADVWTHVMTTYRHSNISLIITSQQAVKLPTLFRSLMTVVMLGNLPIQAHKSLWESFGGDFARLQDFTRMLQRNTPPSGHMFLMHARRPVSAGEVRGEQWFRIQAPAVEVPFRISYDD